MVPTLAKLPPAGPEWLHEVKFDGFRAQVHTEVGTVTIYSRRGADMTRRFRRLKEAVASIPADSAIIDCELVACDESGQPDFRALMNRSFEDCDLCLWRFDLLALDGERMTGSPLSDRRQRLKQLLNEADEQGLVFSQDFGGPDKLLEVAETMGLEGIVSKRRDSLYRAVASCRRRATASPTAASLPSGTGSLSTATMTGDCLRFLAFGSVGTGL